MSQDLTCPWCFRGQVQICREIHVYLENNFWWSCIYSDCNATGPKKNSEQDAISSLASFNKSFQLPNFYRLLAKDGFSHKILELKNMVECIKVPFFVQTNAMTHEAFVLTPPDPMRTKTFVKTSHQFVRLFDYVEKE